MNFLKVMFLSAWATLMAITPPACAGMQDPLPNALRPVRGTGTGLGFPQEHTADSAGPRSKGGDASLQTPPLTDLPDVPFSLILKHLKAKDRAALRATCHALHQQGWKEDAGRTVFHLRKPTVFHLRKPEDPLTALIPWPFTPEAKDYLRTLNLSGNQFDATAAQHLAPALAQMTGLRELNLSNNQLGPTGARHLAPALRQMTELRELNLKFNQFDAAIQLIRDAVAQLPQRVNLRL